MGGGSKLTQENNNDRINFSNKFKCNNNTKVIQISIFAYTLFRLAGYSRQV